MATVSKKNADNPGKKPGISYWSKDKCICPICKKGFEREIMRSGNGRMIAGGLTDELHRIFEPSAKFGRVYPLIYEIGTCPFCYTSLFWNDFKEKQEELPNFADEGWSLVDVQNYCSEKGINVTVEEVETTAYSVGTIISQSRKAGSVLDNVSSITVRVAIAPKKKPEPQPQPETNNNTNKTE